MALQFTGHLFEFQQKVADWSQGLDRGIIGLDMGLGKTVITIAMVCQKSYKHVLVVVPLQILTQWREAFLKFTNLQPKDICVYQGRNRHLVESKVVLTTYDVVRTEMDMNRSPLIDTPMIFDCMILDEAHKIKNKKSLTYQACYQIGQTIDSKWLLSGTVIHNKFDDFYNLCVFLDLPNLPVDQLKSKYYIRMTKADCNDNLQLPNKVIHDHYLDFDDTHLELYTQLQEEVRRLCNRYVTEATQNTYMNILTKILRLRQCCNHPDAILHETPLKGVSSTKFDQIVEIIQQTPIDQKLIIFSQWEHSLNLLGSHLSDHNITYLEYNGSLDISNRNRIIKQFKDTDARVILITIASGGVGLDLSCANHIIIMDSWWNRAMEEQAIDRAYRIGQTRQVEVHRLYIRNSIEDWMIEIKKEKNKVDIAFHQNGSVYTTDKSLLSEILHKYI
jgi:SNF2 family DNA or RNA helicase